MNDPFGTSRDTRHISGVKQRSADQRLPLMNYLFSKYQWTMHSCFVVCISMGDTLTLLLSAVKQGHPTS